MVLDYGLPSLEQYRMTPVSSLSKIIHTHGLRSEERESKLYL